VAFAAVVALLALTALAVLFLRERRARAEADARGAAADERVGLVAGAAQEAIAVFARDHSPELLNPVFVALTGYDAASLLAQAPLLFVLPDDRPPLLTDIADLLASPGSAPRTREGRVLTRGGDVRWCTVTLAAAPGTGGGYLFAATDRTVERAAEERLRRDADLLGAVVEVQQAVGTAGLDADAVMHVIAERCRELTHADGASVLLREGDRLVVRVSAGIRMPSLPVQGSLAGQAIRTGDVAVSHDVTTDAVVDRSSWAPLGIRSLLVAPLLHEGRAIGALKVASTVPGAFGDDDARALRHLSGLLGAALAHASAFEQRQQRLEERTRSLQESEQRFKQLVDTAQEGIWVLDERGVGTYVNPRLAELFGYPAGEMLGRPMLDFMDAVGRAEAQSLLDRAGGEPVRGDFHFRRRDGGELWTIAAVSPIVARDGGPVGSVVMVSDITDRKRAEDRLRHSAERLRTLHEMQQAVLAADSTADVARAALARLRRLVPCDRCSVVLFDDAAHEARLVAGLAHGLPIPEQAFPLTRLSPDEALRRDALRSVDDITVADPRPPIYTQLLAEGIRSLLSVPLRVDGETIGELNLGMAEPGGFEPDHRDVAVEVATPLAVAIQHARLRDELARRTAELERRIADHAAALRQSRADTETLEAGLGRDLRDPLRHVQGFARLLLEEHGEELAPEARHYATRIHDGARELAALVDGLARLARVSRQDLLARPVELNALVEEVLLEVQAGLNGRSIEWDVGRLPLVTGDATLLREALRELIENALRFTASRPSSRIAINPITSETEAGFSVEDNGVGFPPDESGRLFRVFERLHESDGHAGPGLGLALVHRIAQRHGGRAWAQAVPGVGATFHLALPAPGTRGRPEL
jgi:PAS domain S-box-containing protein